MLESLIRSLSSHTGLLGSSCDDWVDKLNHVYTALLLTFSACILITRQYLGKSIACWNPGEADKGHHIEYAENYCWVSDTFVVKDAELFPSVDDNVNHRRISYYQWVPFILLIQAFLFKLPNLAWRLLNSKAGINLDKLIGLALEIQFGNYANREKIITHAAHYIDKWICINKDLNKEGCISCWRKMSLPACLRKKGKFLTSLYFLSKLFYFVNAVAQFYFLDSFLWPNGLNGFYVIVMAFQTGRFAQSPVFPRITFCDFKVRALSEHQFRMQCVLPINMFNEKIFLMFWFWFMFVIFCTGLSLLKTIYICMCKDHTQYCYKYIEYIYKYSKTDVDTEKRKKGFMMEDFSMDYLKRDGGFVLKIIGRASTDIVVVDLITKLWDIYQKENRYSMSELSMDV